MKSSFLGLLAIVGLIAACGAPIEETEPVDAGAQVGGPQDAGVVTDVDGGQVAFTPSGTLGVNGAFFFDVRLPTGQTNLQRGTNSLLVIISHPGGRLTGATVTSMAYMPTMGNMPSPRTPETSEQGVGAYELNPVVCNMGGLWEVAITVTSLGGTVDTYKQDWQVN